MILNGYFIGNINPTFSDKPSWTQLGPQERFWLLSSSVPMRWQNSGSKKTRSWRWSSLRVEQHLINADLNPLDMAWAWHGLESTKDWKYTDHYWPVFTCFYWGSTWKGLFYWAVLHDAQNGISRINFCLFEATPNGKNHSEHPWFLHTFDPMHPLCRRPLLGINTSSIIFYLPRVSNSIVSGKCSPTSSMVVQVSLGLSGKASSTGCDLYFTVQA